MELRTIGIIGGRQVSRMLTLAAKRMGMGVAVLDPDPDAPASQVADRRVIGDLSDAAKIQELAEGCDILTVELEHIDVDLLDSQRLAIQPPPQTIRLIQDKLLQKQHLARQGLPVAPFQDAPSVEAVYAAAETLGYPFMLKARRFSYNGSGNAVIRHRNEIDAALKRIGDQALYAEQWITCEKELVVVVARSLDGTISVYPTVEASYYESILTTVYAPAQTSDPVRQAAAEIASRAISTFEGAGVFGVELMLMPSGDLLINEIVPRPHNAGYYTIEACLTDQFEQHIRAILGLPLGSSALKVGAAVMVNILGAGDDAWAETMRPLDVALSLPGTSIHWYGKTQLSARRKMGHITAVSQSMAALAANLGPLMYIPASTAPLIGIIMGSDYDLTVMKEAASVLRDFGISFEITIVSAHRTPERMIEYARSAHERGIKIIIAGAGGAAHLPGMVAALSPLPVIGVPIRTESLGGQDALYSIVQMPRGVPVAAVAIGGAVNAALLAVRLLATGDPAMQQKMITYQETLEARILAKASALARDGWENYNA